MLHRLMVHLSQAGLSKQYLDVSFRPAVLPLPSCKQIASFLLNFMLPGEVQLPPHHPLRAIRDNMHDAALGNLAPAWVREARG